MSETERFWVARRTHSTGRVIKWISGPFSSERDAWIYAYAYGLDASHRTYITVIQSQRKPRGRAL